MVLGKKGIPSNGSNTQITRMKKRTHGATYEAKIEAFHGMLIRCGK